MTIKARTRECRHCAAIFTEKPNDSNKQWASRKYCNYYCLNRAKKHPAPQTRIEAFFKNVIEQPGNKCWRWGKNLTHGRARVQWNDGTQRRTEVASRVAWDIFYGSRPPEMNVLHKCDNPECTNPDHLFLGTQKDNVRDMWDKGRETILRGEQQPNAKLDNAAVMSILGLIQRGDTISSIAKFYNVSRPVISGIRDGKGWTHITGLNK